MLTNSIINSRDVYFMDDIPEAIDTSFFYSNTIDSLFNYSNLLIERKIINIQQINSNYINNNNNNNINKNAYNNINNINHNNNKHNVGEMLKYSKDYVHYALL